MAAYADSMPFSWLSDHTRRRYKFKVLDAKDRDVGVEINLATYNLQGICYSLHPATEKSAEDYRKSKPRKGQILYTIFGENMQYKYEILPGVIQKRTIAKARLRLYGNLDTDQDKDVLLAHVQQEDYRFQPKRVDNNPFDVNESVENYKKRKIKQIH